MNTEQSYSVFIFFVCLILSIIIYINKFYNVMENDFNNFTETELTNERWKDIDGYDGAYQVSDLGRVRSKKYGRLKIMRPGNNGNEYLRVNLSNGGKIRRFYIHRLVAQAFIPNTDSSKTLINHINEIKSDNKVSNLEWCTAQYNSTYNDIHHRHITYKRDKLKELYEPNLSIDKNLEIFKENGIECCGSTVTQLRKDLNLKGRSNYKRNAIKDLYDPNLTYKENLELFKANGIECCEQTIRNLRKDLGLTGSRNVRNKVKDLYDQNLTYAENLEVFKANGVECSMRVINSIRKDLGLVKSTKKK